MSQPMTPHLTSMLPTTTERSALWPLLDDLAEGEIGLSTGTPRVRASTTLRQKTFSPSFQTQLSAPGHIPFPAEAVIMPSGLSNQGLETPSLRQRRHHKIKVACERCRGLKIRCSGNADNLGCTSCRKTGINPPPCIFRPLEDLTDLNGQRSRSKRRRIACDVCRKRKTRCIPGMDGHGCAECQGRDKPLSLCISRTAAESNVIVKHSLDLPDSSVLTASIETLPRAFDRDHNVRPDDRLILPETYFGRAEEHAPSFLRSLNDLPHSFAQTASSPTLHSDVSSREASVRKGNGVSIRPPVTGSLCRLPPISQLAMSAEGADTARETSLQADRSMVSSFRLSPLRM